MEFVQHKPIYLQIAESLCDRILSGEWKEEERIPSVRELGVTFGVNPNTIMRTYESLERENIIFNKRGIGYFVSAGAVSTVRASLRKDFIEHNLPVLFKSMDLLGITLGDLTELYENHEKENIHEDR